MDREIEDIPKETHCYTIAGGALAKEEIGCERIEDEGIEVAGKKMQLNEERPAEAREERRGERREIQAVLQELY
jgi:hypothetical protein